MPESSLKYHDDGPCRQAASSAIDPPALAAQLGFELDSSDANPW